MLETEEEDEGHDDERLTIITVYFKDPVAPLVRYCRACRRDRRGVDCSRG